MNKFKNSLNVTGEEHHLEAFSKDLEAIGYKHHTKTYKGGYITINCANGQSESGSNPNGTYRRVIYPDARDYSLTLPADWQKALELAWEKEEVKEEFKVGDWVVMLAPNSSPKIYTGTVGKLLEIDDDLSIDPYKVYYTETGYIWNQEVRKATPEEIEKHLISEAEKKGFVKGAKVTTRGRIFEIDELTTKNYQGRDIDTLYLWSKGNSCECSIDGAKLLPSYPLIEKLGYTAKFEEWGISFNDCAKFGKDTFISLHEMFLLNKIDPYTNRDIEYIKIGKAEFTPKEIKLIAEHFNKKS